MSPPCDDATDNGKYRFSQWRRRHTCKEYISYEWVDGMTTNHMMTQTSFMTTSLRHWKKSIITWAFSPILPMMTPNAMQNTIIPASINAAQHTCKYRGFYRPNLKSKSGSSPQHFILLPLLFPPTFSFHSLYLSLISLLFFYPSLPLPSLFSPPLCVSSLLSFYRGPTPLVQLGGLWARCERPIGSGQSSATKRFVVHFEL